MTRAGATRHTEQHRVFARLASSFFVILGSSETDVQERTIALGIPHPKRRHPPYTSMTDETASQCVALGRRSEQIGEPLVTSKGDGRRGTGLCLLRSRLSASV